MSEAKDKQPSPDEIRAEIADRQQQLAQSVDELTARTSPKALVDQGKARATSAARDAVYSDDGSLRVERIAVVAGAVIVLVGLRLWLRSRRH